MDPVLKILIEGGQLTTAQMAQVAGATEAEIDLRLEQLKKDKILLGWRPVIDLSRVADAGRRPRGDRGQDHARAGRGLQPPGRAPEPFRRGGIVLPHVGGLRPADLRVRASLQKVAGFVSEKLSTIEGVLSTSTHFMLRSYKEGGYLIDAPPESSGRLKVSP